MLTGKRVLIIGGTSGFGLEVARQALAQQAQVALIGRHQARLDAALTSLDSPAVAGTVLDAQQAPALTAYLQQLGPVDHVVSFLGGAMGGGFLDSKLALIKQTVADKFFANLQVAQLVAPYLQPKGSLIFTSGAGGTPATASGAIIGNQAINTMVQGLAVEMAPQIRVNAVAPTWTPTGLWRDLTETQRQQQADAVAQSLPLQRIAQPKEVAAAYLYLMQSDFTTGQVLTIAGGADLV